VDTATKGKTGHRERLRERFLLGEASSRSDDAVLELLLTYCIPHRDVQPLAKSLLAKFGTLEKVLAADQSSLCSVDGVGSHVSTILKLGDYLCQLKATTEPVSIAESKSSSPLSCLSDPGAGSNVQQEQPKLNTNIPSQTELPLVLSQSTVKERKSIQDVLIPEGLLALKLAHEAKSMDELQSILIKQLGQNSMATRSRYSQSILRWFFPNGLTGLLPRVWQAYQDETICIDLLRWSYLSSEPIMGRCVVDALFPCENGLVIPATYFDKFLEQHLGEAPQEIAIKRLKCNLKRIGFLDRSRGKPDRLASVSSQKTSFLILLHFLFAAKTIRTVELKNLLANPFWMYLGYKTEDSVRSLLREADGVGLLGKYVVADQLEQVTTCFTLDELLERRVRL
jgi:DNA repair protein RadC